MAQKEYRPQSLDEQMDLSEGTVEDVVRVLGHLKPNEFYTKQYPAAANTEPLQDYVERLKKGGLDIGKGDATFGFRMPLPERGVPRRDLVIFRRH